MFAFLLDGQWLTTYSTEIFSAKICIHMVLSYDGHAMTQLFVISISSICFIPEIGDKKLCCFNYTSESILPFGLCALHVTSCRL